jgi:hypothetical protein
MPWVQVPPLFLMLLPIILFILFNFSILYFVKNWALSFQDPATPVIKEIINFGGMRIVIKK